MDFPAAFTMFIVLFFIEWLYTMIQCNNETLSTAINQTYFNYFDQCITRYSSKGLPHLIEIVFLNLQWIFTQIFAGAEWIFIQTFAGVGCRHWILSIFRTQHSKILSTSAFSEVKVHVLVSYFKSVLCTSD